MMDLRQLFLNKLQELRRLMTQPSEFHMLQASAIVRQLLIDERPLLPLMKRITNQPIIFQTKAAGMVEWSKSITGSYPQIFTVGHSIGPSRTENQTKKLKLKEFLALKVLILWDDIYTVHDVLTYCANAAGGVHHTPKSDRLKTMLAKPEVGFNGVPAIPQLMEGISDAVDWVCRPHELFLLNRLGREALLGGAPRIAINYFERTVCAAEGIKDHRPDLWALFQSNLAEAREAASNLPEED